MDGFHLLCFLTYFHLHYSLLAWHLTVNHNDVNSRSQGGPRCKSRWGYFSSENCVYAFERVRLVNLQSQRFPQIAERFSLKIRDLVLAEFNVDTEGNHDPDKGDN